MNRISLLTIGDELLRGRVVNTNATEAALILRRYGYTLHRVLSVGDTREAILDAVESELSRSEIVLTSGGLGPTKDDITKHTLAEWAGGGWVWHQPTLEALEQRFAARGRPLNDLTRRQALVPEACEVVFNLRGTAPGMAFRRAGKLLVSMPGVPFEMLHMLEHAVVPLLQGAFPADAFRSFAVRMTDIPESEAAARMEALEPQFPPELSVSYLPRLDGLWIEVSMRHPDPEAAAAGAQRYGQLVAELFADKLYTTGDRPLAAELGALLRERGLTLAAAESMTGGRLSAALVSVSGASDYYLGGVTAYAVPVKMAVLGVPEADIQTHGVVSEAVAKAMAEGVRRALGAQVGLATTGLAEADGGQRPQVWIACAAPDGVQARRLELYYDRQVNIEYAANYAMNFCLKVLRGRGE
ncbi:MAG: CinA family nicotinamide mononucleotide deamidase-related protein [Bacteroidia bacterium]|nr:CinA family nicotinamide mononucleotide deamidase-related protein [Bacteroidia bacterium]